MLCVIMTILLKWFVLLPVDVRTGGKITLLYTQYTTQLQDSHQFMSTVMSSDEQFNERPQSDPLHATSRDIWYVQPGILFW